MSYAPNKQGFRDQTCCHAVVDSDRQTTIMLSFIFLPGYYNFILRCIWLTPQGLWRLTQSLCLIPQGLWRLTPGLLFF